MQSAEMKLVEAIDLFCGAGGLTRGLMDVGISVLSGYDLDDRCRYAFETNNAPAKFYRRDVGELTSMEIKSQFSGNSWQVMVGCAPCQPFSTYTQGARAKESDRWQLLNHFGRLVDEVNPHVVSMENVVGLAGKSVYSHFVQTLESRGFWVTAENVYCPRYGVPQHRTRLVILASRLGPIHLTAPSHTPLLYKSVREAIEHLPKVNAGESDANDRLHRAASLTSRNLQRIRHSKASGSWKDWPEDLVAECHKRDTGKTYRSVYGRMAWDRTSPTITTQFYGFGSGRFGHPVQDRALTLREGAVLQSFPPDYDFIPPDEAVSFKVLGRLIGNAVPVRLGQAIGRSILEHLKTHER